MGITPVAQYKPTNMTAQSGSDYKNTLDGNSVAAQRIVTRFAPHAAASPNMTVVLDAGSIFDGITLAEVAAQATGTITAPVSHQRIDRVVLDNVTGTASVVAGAESTAPVPPAIPNGKSPVAQIALAVGVSAITNAIVTDERNFSALATGGFGAQTPIGSAATCDLGIVLSRNAKITGMTTITSFGASANTQSPIYLIEFAAALTLKSGAGLLLPGSVDIAAVGGDTAVAEYLGAGNWRVRSYMRADGSSIDVFQADNGSTAGIPGLVPPPSAGDAAAHKVLGVNGWVTQTPFISAPQGITAGQLLTIPHGLGVMPTDFTAWLLCVTAEGGWSVNDMPMVCNNANLGGNNGVSRGYVLWADATNIYIRFGSYANATFDLLNKANGGFFNITNTKWSFVIGARP